MSSPLENEEMLSCLARSGYLLEGRLAEHLSKAGFFVESSKAYLDPRTGISREIDIEATLETITSGVHINTSVIIESINNTYPVVLLTRSQNEMSYLDSIRYSFVPVESREAEHPFDEEIGNELHVMPDSGAIYAQYCTFARKKDRGELMALHSDDLHGAIQKSSEHLLSQHLSSKNWKWDEDETTWMVFKWRAAIVLQGALFEYENGKLKPVEVGQLQYNLHFQGKPETIIIHFVTEIGFPRYVERMKLEDIALVKKMKKLRLS